MSEKILINAAELADTLGIGRSQAYTLLHREDFPTVRLGRRILVPVDGLRAWIAQQTGKEGSRE